MKQSAVEWLANELYEKFKMKGDGALFNDLVEQAKEIHKQQIMDAWEDGQNSFPTINAKQYYKETFNTPTPWYDEDKLTERMDIIGQNGNEGEHYNK